MRRSLLLAVVVSGCGSLLVQPGDAGADAGTTQLDGGAADAGAVDAGYVPDPLVVARPFGLVVPTGYAGAPAPLVVLLHGYTGTAANQDAYFRLSQLAQQRTFLLALPNGTTNAQGQQFWNATDACCGFGATVDDVAYLTAVIDDVKARYAVDGKRVFLVGHSNGGFMSHRLACERASRIAGLVSLAGATWQDASRCAPSEPVSVLQVHGTADAVIRYDGGTTSFGAPTYPGAVDTVSRWRAKNGCSGTTLAGAGAALDLVLDLPGPDTRREAFGACPAGGAVELWTIEGGSHIPVFNGNWAPALYDWLLAHPKP